MIWLRFVSGISAISALIRWQQYGDWSHVDVLFPDGRLLGALEGKGVVFHDGGKCAHELYVGVPVPDASAAYAWFLNQEGKGYDYWGCIAGFLFRSDWFNDQGKWFCSEMGCRGLVEGGLRSPLAGKANRVSPPGLLQMLSWVDGVIAQPNRPDF